MDETIGLFRRNSDCSAEQKTLGIPFRTIPRTEVGKHPDLLVGPPTSTVFPTNDRNFERSQFFEKIFEKI